MPDTVHIGKAAHLAGVTVDTIRFYQKVGLIEGTGRTGSGYRLFDEEQIRDLRFVRHAQELGFSLAEVKDLLELRRKDHACSEVQAMLGHKLAGVRERIKNLTLLEAELAAALRSCNRELRLQREVKHEDCCPLLTKLDRMNGPDGKQDVESRTESSHE